MEEVEVCELDQCSITFVGRLYFLDIGVEPSEYLAAVSTP